MVTAERDTAPVVPPAELRPSVVALSDDLTGAAALTGEFAACGLEARVVPWSHDGVPAAGVDALVVDTASRGLTAGDAAGRVIASAGGPAPRCGWYKRIDSALRGNVAAELAAFATTTDRPLVVSAAAPELGIVTRDGTQLFDEVPVAASHFGAGPDGCETSRLADLLPAVSLGLDVVRGPRLTETLRALAADGRHAICDAEREEDLVRAGEALASPGLLGRVAPVGSYGLAQAWAGALPLARTRRAPVLAAVSSMKPASRRQVEIAGLRGAHVVTGADIAAAQDALRAGRDSVLVTPPATDLRTAHAEALARDVVLLARDGSIAGLVIVGGDLASAFLDAARASAGVVATPWAATPVTCLDGGALDGRHAIFKSGAKGGSEWLHDAMGVVRALAERGRAPHA